MRRFAPFIVPVLMGVADRILKYFVFPQPLGSGEVAHFGAIFLIPYSNYHFAFGLPVPSWLTISGSLLIICLFGAWLAATRTPHTRLALVYVILGAASNVFDRIAFGAVRDYLSVFPNGFFNIADLMIIAGIAWIIFTHRKQTA